MKSARGPIAAMVPGVLLVGYIAVELLILKWDSHIPTGVEIVYFLLGFFLVDLAVLLRRQSVTARSLPI